MTPRSLVGMTMGARKRRARAVTYVALNEVTFVETAEALAAPIHCARFHARKFPRHGYDLQLYKFVRLGYRIGQRLRPCPGCQECGVRRFTKPEGFFSDNTHYVEIRDNAKVRLWRLKHKPILWRSKCGPRSVPTKFYDLEYCVGMVERFEWIELTQPNLCDGSGVLPARAKKVRR